MAHPTTQAAGEGTAALARFEPNDGDEFLAFMDGLPDQYFDPKAQHFSTLAQRVASEFPVEPAFADVFAELAAIERQSAQKARETLAVFYREHEREIQRIREPRHGEAKWNVPA